MRVSVHLGLWTACPTAGEHRNLLCRIKEWGFDGIEVPVAPMSDSDIRALAALSDDLGLGRVVNLVLHAGDADPASADPALRAAAVECVKRVVDRTHALGADLIAGPLFQGLGNFSGAGPTTQEWLWAVDTIRDCATYANAAGVRLALEPLNRFEMYLVNTLADGVRFVRDVGLPNVGLLADSHHAHIEEADTARAWLDAADYIFHIHISESHRSTPGTGQALPPAIFLALQQMQYQGWLGIEAFGQGVAERIARLHLWRVFPDSEEDIARKGLRFIRRQCAAWTSREGD